MSLKLLSTSPEEQFECKKALELFIKIFFHPDFDRNSFRCCCQNRSLCVPRNISDGTVCGKFRYFMTFLKFDPIVFCCSPLKCFVHVQGNTFSEDNLFKKSIIFKKCWDSERVFFGWCSQNCFQGIQCNFLSQRRLLMKVYEYIGFFGL